MTLNAAIGIVGVLLLGFIYSFSRNVSHTGVPIIEVTFPKVAVQSLAVDVYMENPIQDNYWIDLLNSSKVKNGSWDTELWDTSVPSPS